MPTYEYACGSCGTHIEVFQRFSDESLTECPTCGGPLRKVFHPAGILFKGSGFYRTDSRSKSGSAPGKKAAKSDGDGGKAGEKVATASGSEAASGSKADGGSGGSSGSSGSTGSGSSKATGAGGSGGSKGTAA